MSDNPFDQFDQPANANPFDQFDEKPGVMSQLATGAGNTLNRMGRYGVDELKGAWRGLSEANTAIREDFTRPLDEEQFGTPSEGLEGELEKPFLKSAAMVSRIAKTGMDIVSAPFAAPIGAAETHLAEPAGTLLSKAHEVLQGEQPMTEQERQEAGAKFVRDLANIPMFALGAAHAPEAMPYVGEIKPVPLSPVADYAIMHSPIAPVMDAFGAGPKSNWGTQYLTDSFADLIDNKKISNELAEGQADVTKAFNGAFLRSSSAQLLKGGDLVTNQLAEARSLGIIGEGEEGWKGTTEPTPEQLLERNAAAQQVSPIEEQPDIHVAARQAAPEVFSGPNGYDALLSRQDTFRRWLDELAEKRDSDFATTPPRADEMAPLQDKIDTILGKVNGVEDRLTKTKAAQLADLRDQLSDIQEDSQRLATQDTADMARVRAELQKNDYKMRDLAPQVSAAYREAAARMPKAEPVEAPEPAPQAPAEGAQPVPEPVAQEVAGKVMAAQNEPQPVKEPLGRTTPVNIAQDVAQKLVSAGRPKEEADAAGQLIQAYYETRSARFGGAKGTGPELYAKEAPEIRAGRGVTAKAEAEKEYAQAAYHGSPHIFDKFTLDHIGTGEGAQAYGHGLYFAGSKAVAKFYRETLSGETFHTARGKVFDPSSLEHLNVRNAVRRNGTDLDASIARARDLLTDASEQTRPMLERDIAKLEALKADGGIVPNKGRLYHVELAPEEHAYLDWDKPLDEQSPQVQAALEKLAPDFYSAASHDFDAKEPGEIIYHRLSSIFGSPEKASERLHEGGVPGIRYLDQASRNAGGWHITPPDQTISGKWMVKSADYNSKGLHFDNEADARAALQRKLGEETRNYVVFNDKDVAIKSYEQQMRGKIAIREARNIITLMKDANASTFIHETGHQWLEDLMRDGADPQAPTRVHADEQVVRKYLGAEPNGDLTTRQHEKFARSFERYMMEGRAPSKALADVFAKFKDWLTKIYETVTKLRAPINDDIRDVFDRLLSRPNEEPVIAPDSEPEKSLADIHESDVANTPPQHADPVRDTVEQEVDQVAKQKAPNVYPDLANAAKAPELPTEASGHPEPLGGPEQNAAGTGNAEAPGAVTESGGGVGGEGPVVRAEPSPAGGNPAGKPEPEQPTGPNSKFTGPDSSLVDKAGNIVLKNLNTPEDINAVLRQTASDNGDFFAARRGVLSDGAVIDLADALGMDASTLNRRKIGEAWNAEQIVAARNLLVQSANEVRDAMVKAANGTDQEVMAYGEAAARHRMIQEQVSGITAEAGRALRAFRRMEGQENAEAVGKIIGDEEEKTLFQLREQARLGASLETPQQVSKFINDVEKSRVQKLKDGILEYYINALISGPITHMRYSVGNAINALWTPLIEIPTAAGISAAKEAIGIESEDRVYLGEAMAQIYGMSKGAREGYRAAVTAFKENASPPLPGEKITGDFLGAKPQAIPGMAGKIIGVPGRSVASIHSFFKSLRYEQNIQGLAYRQAASEGLTGDAFSNRIANLTKSPTEQMMLSATQDALKELYMAPTEYSSFMGGLNRAINSSLPAKIIVPFMKIGTEITKNAFLERTPLGIFSKDIRANLMGENGSAAQSMQLAKMTAGVSLMGITMLMAAEGMATGDGPEDPKARATWLLTHSPNHIHIGDISIPYQGLGSLGMLMRFSANAYETAHGWDGEDFGKVAVSALEGLSKSVLDENFMRGVKDMLDAVYHPGEYGQRYVQSFATNWLPFSVGLGQVAREVDPYQRASKDLFDAARAKIPFVSESLHPRYDMFGQPLANGGQAPRYDNDPVVKGLADLQTGVGRLSDKIRGVKLTADQYDNYSRVAGRLTYTQLQSLMRSPGWSTIPAAQRVQVVSRTITAAREMAGKLVMQQSMGGPDDIVRQAIDAKRSILEKH